MKEQNMPELTALIVDLDDETLATVERLAAVHGLSAKI
jgi:hypothetical protein